MVARASDPEHCVLPAQDVIELASKAASNRFVIPAEEVQQLLQKAGCSMDALLLSFLDEAAHVARPPISNYKVGAVGLGASGAVYFGGNLEFPHNPLSQSVHAEQFLMANLVLHNERGLHTLAISAAPCGHCRQFYSELGCADSVRFVFGHRGHNDPEVWGLEQLLPARFGPSDLLGDAAGEKAPLLLEPQQHCLSWTRASQQTLQQRAADATFHKAADAGLQAAHKAYSPYTHCPAAIAFILRTGQVAAGCYLESAAHNPGLAPLQSAVVSGIMSGCLQSYDQIQEVVLVEVQDAKVSHAGIARVVSSSWGGNASVTVLTVTSRGLAPASLP